MKKIFFLMLFNLFFAVGSFANSSIKVENLRTEYLRNPIGIDAAKPRFSWNLSSNEKGIMQSAYQITVSTDKAGNNPVWTSGKIISDKSVHIEYNGRQLSPSTRYYWRVDVWTNKSKSTSNELAFFETGLLNEGWGNAKWIKAPALKELSNQPVHFVLETDVTLIKDNAGIVFSARDPNNMYMWSINTYDVDQPILRRHIFTNGNVSYTSDVSIGKHFSKQQLIDTEHHLKIEVKDNTIKTYLDNTLLDSFSDTSNNLIDGYIGFRAFKSNSLDETATYDNIILTTYSKNEKGDIKPTITVSENFENEKNIFEDIPTIKKGNNTKLYINSQAGESRILQNRPSTNPMFRNEFAITKKVESAKIYTSGLGVYDLFVNGKRVGVTANGKVVYDELKPGASDYFKTVLYSSYDISNLLTLGSNAVGAIVSDGWWAGSAAWGRYGTPSLGFIAKLVIKYTDGTTEQIVSDTSWKTSMSKTLLLGDIYHGETYDARFETNWTSPKFDDSDWGKVSINTDFKGKIAAFVGPPVRVRPEMERKPIAITTYNGIKNDGTDFGVVDTIDVARGAKVIELKKGQTVIYDMGQNMVGWVKFTVKGQSGTKMRFQFAEMLNDSGKRNRGNDGPAGSLYRTALRSAKATLNYTLKGGQSETFHPSSTFFGFRYCAVIATQDVRIESLVGEVVGSITEEGSSLDTSNPLINQLYRNILWGQRSNYLSIPTDCPQRDERMGWTGDTQMFIRAATYNSDVDGFFHKWMGDMRDSQLDNGAYPNVAPLTWNDRHGNGAWTEAGLIVPWTIYLVYNDKGILEDNYVSMEKFMQFLANGAGDGYKYNGSDIAFGDWLSYEGTDKRYISVAYYAYSAQLMAKMSQVLSKQDVDMYAQKAKQYNELHANVVSEFQQRYVNQDGTLKEKSQTAYLLALQLDLFPDKTATDNAVKYLTQKIAANGNKLSTGFVGTGILNQTLSKLGADDTAYNLLLQRNNPSWLYSIDQGATTIWERWNSYTISNGFGDAGMNSFNHYAYGAVLEWMYRYMAGIETDESNPGYKHIILQPTPDIRKQLPEGQENIAWVKASYDSYYGVIQSSWKMKQDGRIVYTATVPANTTATLYLPIVDDSDVVYENKVLTNQAKYLKPMGIKNGKAIFELQSGSYNFEVKRK